MPVPPEVVAGTTTTAYVPPLNGVRLVTRRLSVIAPHATTAEPASYNRSMQLEELRKELDLHWTSRDYPRVATVLTQAQELTVGVPDIESRSRIADVIRRYVTPERLNILMLDFIGGALPAEVAARFWDLTPDEVIWPILLDTWCNLPNGDSRSLLLGALRNRAAKNMELLNHSLSSPEPHRAQAATALRESLWGGDIASGV